MKPQDYKEVKQKSKLEILIRDQIASINYATINTYNKPLPSPSNRTYIRNLCGVE